MQSAVSSDNNNPSVQSILINWSLKSKNFVVTGGSLGIGYETVRSLLANGASGVVICSRRECTDTVNKLQDEFPNSSVHAVACDVSTEDGRSKLVSEVKKQFGTKLHGLVNNVGVNVRKTVMEQTTEEYHNILRTNIDSAYFLSKSLKEMLANAAAETGSSSTIVNVASAAGVVSSGTGAVYGMSKAAMIQLTKNLACEWAKLNIRVNAVAPWMTMTPLLEDAVKSNPSQLDKVKEWTPMHRLGTPEEVAGPITFLCMPSSGYMTGQCLSIDGGLTAQGFDGPCVTPQD
uniref:Uncharacterized protein n=1 Tax=Ditylum brightwellii TaxID=49249 RepID=A0A7S4QIT9_9STRA